MGSKTKYRRLRSTSLLLLATMFTQLPKSAMAVNRQSDLQPGAGSGLSQSQFGQELQGLPGGVSEYFYRRDRDDVLVPVYMLGEVTKPGIYHVPVKSDLVTLLSIAGGLSSSADHDGIHVRDARQPESVKVTMNDILRDSKAKPRVLLGNEVIFVEKSEPWISNNTMLVIGFLSGLVGIWVGSKALSK